MATKHLTATNAAAAKPKSGKSYWLWSKDQPGFGLKIQATGSRSFYYVCRVNGTQRFTQIAPYGSIPFEQALGIATELAVQAARARNNIEGATYRPEKIVKPDEPERAPLTVGEMFQFYFDQHGKDTKRPDQLQNIWKRHCQPLAAKPVTELDVERVQEWHDGIDAPVAALHAVQLLRAAARRCIKKPSKSGWPAGFANPFAGIEVEKAKPRTRKLEGRDLVNFGAAADRHPDLAIRSFMLALHVMGARISELQFATIQQYDKARRCIIREDSKNDDVRVLTAGPVTGKLLDQVIGKRTTGLIWPGHRKDGGFDFRKAWVATCKAAGVADYTFHDARRSFAQALAATGEFSDFTIEELLGHKLPGVQKHYRSLDIHSPVRAKAAAAVEAAMGMTKRPARATQKPQARRAA